MRIAWTSLTVALLICLCACGQGTTGQAGSTEQMTWQEQYDLGVRYLEDGDYEEAIIAFTAAIEIDPKRAPAYVGRGDAYSGTAQKLTGQAEDGELPDEAVSSYGSAVADYLAALDLDESTAEVYRKAAEVYVTLGDLDSAVALLERGVSATGDEDIQIYLDEIMRKQYEETNGMVTVLGRIIYNPTTYENLWHQCEEKTRNNSDRTIYAMETFGIQFESPVSFWLDSSKITLKEAEANNLDAHFDYVTDLYNSRTFSSGPLLGQLMELTGYFIKRDPPGELIGPEKIDEFTEYVYHPNGDYAFYLESYKLLD